MNFSLSTFVKSLGGRFGRNQVQKSCELAIDSLRQHSIPAYDQATDFFKEYKIRSPEGKSVENTVRKYIKVGSSGNWVGGVRDGLNAAVSTLEKISKKSESLYADHEFNAALTFQKATYLRLIGNISFVNDFSRKLLNYVYISEFASMPGVEDMGVSKELAPVDVKYIEDNLINFCVCMKVLQKPFEEIERSVDEMPDAIVSESSESVMRSNLGDKTIDPLGMNAMVLPIRVSVKWNIFYLFGMLVADFQNACYKASREELSLLQLRLLNLKKAQEKKQDANLQYQIEKMQERVNELNYDVSRWEQKYA